MRGRALGVRLFLEEAISEREPPRMKAWRTIGEPRLLVIGAYRLGFRIEPEGAGSRLRVLIEYQPPSKHPWLGALLGAAYAKWCCERMLADARRAFARDREGAAA
jgi:hypothetical protein